MWIDLRTHSLRYFRDAIYWKGKWTNQTGLQLGKARKKITDRGEEWSDVSIGRDEKQEHAFCRIINLLDFFQFPPYKHCASIGQKWEWRSTMATIMLSVFTQSKAQPFSDQLRTTCFSGCIATLPFGEEGYGNCHCKSASPYSVPVGSE